jgi:hypothetical protein
MLETRRASEVLAEWPELAREAAQLVVDQYGEPHEVTPSELRWYGVGPWKRIMAQRAVWAHNFPAPHHDSVESVIDYRVPIDRISPIAAFDGSVVVERTTGEISARCHDEQANMLALNLAHDIVVGDRTIDQAREYYAEEFLNARRKRPTPYMDALRFTPLGDAASDPDERVLSDEDLERAKAEGATNGPG